MAQGLRCTTRRGCARSAPYPLTDLRDFGGLWTKPQNPQNPRNLVSPVASRGGADRDGRLDHERARNDAQGSESGETDRQTELLSRPFASFASFRGPDTFTEHARHYNSLNSLI